MSTLTIGMLDAEVADSRRTDPGRVDRLLRRVAGSTLADQRAAQDGLAGEWCVRRVEIDLQLDPGEPDSAAASRWAEQITGAIGDLVPDGRTVIHYPNRALAVADAVRSTATGHGERAWAWRQLGVLGPDDPEPAADPAGALLAVLAGEPGTALAALAATAARGGLPALDRLLGQAGWRAAAGLVAPAAVLRAALAAVDSRAGADAWEATDGAAQPAAPANPDGAAGGDLPAVTTRARAEAVLAGSRLLGAALDAVAGERLAPTAAVIAAWAVLGTVEVEPHRPAMAAAVATALLAQAGAGTGRAAVLPGRPAEPVVQPAGAPAADAAPAPSTGPPKPTLAPTAARSVDPTQAATPVARTAAPAGERTGSAVRPVGLGPAGRRPVDAEPAADGGVLDDRIEGATDWAGLVFLLNSAAAAGLPQAVDDDLRLAARPLSWVVHQIGQRMVPVPAADPAALALAGLAPDAALPAGAEPSPDEEVALTGHAQRWAAVTTAALAAAAAAQNPQAQNPEAEPAPTLWSLARRPGRILADPGWLEVHLALDTVDVTVRRAGLDVDPGWLDWLGVVVRICYG